MSYRTSVLRVEDLKIRLYSDQAELYPVDGVSFEINPSECFALVGESGCGKSLTALSILDLLIKPQLEIAEGSIYFNGENLVGLTTKRMQSIRAESVSMIFQDPLLSLNPVKKIGWQIEEVFRYSTDRMTQNQRRERALHLLEKVEIVEPERIYSSYPHQLSGGMLQRVMIAIAIASEPQLLIADEPTTALDVTTQYQIMSLLNELKSQSEMAILLITHDLALVSEFADQVAVMYAGQIVETASRDSFVASAKHPYSRALIASSPSVEDAFAQPFEQIEGALPDLSTWDHACRFRERCKLRGKKCDIARPSLEPVDDQSQLACFYWKDER